MFAAEHVLPFLCSCVLVVLSACSRTPPATPKDAGASSTRPHLATQTEIHVPEVPSPASPRVENAGDKTEPTAEAADENRVDARSACSACNGEWGVHGLVQAESCNCRTKDVGKRCRDGGECEGQCIADAGEREVTSKGPPELGFFIGQCSEFVTTFGCHRMLPRGALNKGPARLDQPPPALCMD